MNKKEICEYASKVWYLLVEKSRWTLNDLKRKSGLSDSQLGAALGWLANEDKIELHKEEEKDETYVSISLNLYIG